MKKILVYFTNSQFNEIEVSKDIEVNFSKTEMVIIDNNIGSVKEFLYKNLSLVVYEPDPNEEKMEVDTKIFDTSINLLYSEGGNIKTIKLSNCINVEKNENVLSIDCLTRKLLTEKYFIPLCNIVYIQKDNYKMLTHNKEEIKTDNKPIEDTTKTNDTPKSI